MRCRSRCLCLAPNSHVEALAPNGVVSGDGGFGRSCRWDRWSCEKRRGQRGSLSCARRGRSRGPQPGRGPLPRTPPLRPPEPGGMQVRGGGPESVALCYSSPSEPPHPHFHVPPAPPAPPFRTSTLHRQSPRGGVGGACRPSVTVGGWAQAQLGVGPGDTPGRKGRREGLSRGRDGANGEAQHEAGAAPATCPGPLRPPEGTGSRVSCCHWEHSGVLSPQGPCLVSAPACTILTGCPRAVLLPLPSPEPGPLSPPPGCRADRRPAVPGPRCCAVPAELRSPSMNELPSPKRDKHSLALTQLSEEETRNASQDARA